ncbi:MAG TPA: electron transport complex subunit E [Dehalococcoidia bacterium]|nr:electron transport complex subunit E [Dehalococcoidia bacterium]
MSGFTKEFIKGLITSNPIFVLALGLCPALATTTSLENALGLSAAVTFVLLASSTMISLIRKFIPGTVRIPVFIIIIATFVTVANMLFQAYIPTIYNALGIYLPLIVAYCIVLGRAEAFASKNKVSRSIADALGIGIGFTLALILIASIREILGTGGISIFGNDLFTLPGLGDNPIYIFILPAGAFLVVGLLLALFRWTGVTKNG